MGRRRFGMSVSTLRLNKDGFERSGPGQTQRESSADVV